MIFKKKILIKFLGFERVRGDKFWVMYLKLVDKTI